MRKALVFLYALNQGGHSITAVELAASLRQQSAWDVVIFGSPGPVAELAAERGLRVVFGREGGMGISPRDMRMFRRVCRDERPDLVHAWDWRPLFNAYYSAYLGLGIPLIGTITAMFPPTILPPAINLSFVSEEIRARDPRRQPRNFLLDPPINTDTDDPSLVDSREFLRTHGLDEESLHLVLVSRLARDMKLDGILRTIDAVGQLAGDRAADLVVVGGGDSEAEVRAAASATNARVGREVVRLTGPMVDPRPAYAAADIVVGMGTSIARGMTFGKPGVVLGEDGFSEIFDETTADALMRAGLYGHGSGAGPNHRLREQLEALVGDDDRRRALGEYSRERITSRFDLKPLARVLAARYDEAVREGVRRSPFRVADALVRAVAVGGAYQLKPLVPAQLRERFWSRHAAEPNRAAAPVRQFPRGSRTGAA